MEDNPQTEKQATGGDAPSVLLSHAKDNIEASLLMAVGGQGSLALGELPADVLLVDIHVPKADHARAIGLVDQFFGENQGKNPWTCASCGEAVGKTFSNCWNCDGPRPDTA